MIKAYGFDIEIGDVLPDFASWRSRRPLKISCIGLSPTETDGIVYYDKEEGGFVSKEIAQTCVKTMYHLYKEGYTCVTWNGLAFDWVVLSDTSGMHDVCKKIAMSAQHVDLMFAMYMALGYGVGLGTAGVETIGRGKIMSGAHAPVAWAEGEQSQVLDYVLEDATITREIWCFLKQQRVPTIKWRTRSGHGFLKQMQANRHWNPTWSVIDLLEKCPQPKVASFMQKPPRLADYVGEWLNGV